VKLSTKAVLRQVAEGGPSNTVTSSA